MIEEVLNSKSVAEFFAGIGLMRLGLEEAGWSFTIANDIDPVKQKLYLNHFTESVDDFILGDIHKLPPKRIPNITLATASFPCTDLSLAGKRAGLNGESSSAFWGFINVLDGLENRKPPLVLLENVAGFLTSNGGLDFKEALLALNKLGYLVDAFLIDAAHFVPQSRVRLFIIGKLCAENAFKIKHYFPETELRPRKIRDFIYQHPEINWSINLDLPKLPKLQNGLSDIIEHIPKTSKLWWNKERVKYLLNQTSEKHLSQLMENKIKAEYSYFTAFRRVRKGKSMAEIRFDGIAGCLRTPKGGSARQILLEVGNDEVNIRLLSPKECARLMGADNFTLSGTSTEALFGFGDAVCVPVVSWIAKNYLNKELDKLGNSTLSDKKYAKSA